MTTQPTNHRAAARFRLNLAEEISAAETDDPDPGTQALISISHWLGALHDVLAELREDDPEPRHRRELDEDDPDTLVEDDDTVEQRFGLAYIPDNAAGYGPSEEPADRVRLSGFAAIHRHDDFGPPWGAA